MFCFWTRQCLVPFWYRKKCFISGNCFYLTRFLHSRKSYLAINYKNKMSEISECQKLISALETVTWNCYWTWKLWKLWKLFHKMYRTETALWEGWSCLIYLWLQTNSSVNSKKERWAPENWHLSKSEASDLSLFSFFLFSRMKITHPL